MSALVRPWLSLVLCLLFAAWGTCPCALAHALGADGGADEATQASVGKGGASARDVPPGCPCCCGRASEDAGDASGEAPRVPDNDRRCGRSANPQDLARLHVPVLDAPAEAFLCAPPALCSCEPARGAVAAPGRDAGPPEGNAPHACPVGIVLLLN